MTHHSSSNNDVSEDDDRNTVIENECDNDYANMCASMGGTADHMMR